MKVGLSEQGSGPLAGVRVLDMTHVLAGPWCTIQLGDMGADVIKVEQPSGDMTRFIGERRSPGMSSFFLSLNRNKRSIVLDLKKDGGRDVFLRLAATADVFICNVRRSVLPRLGIAYDDLAAVNPAIVYCSIVGYGPEHEKADLPFVDDAAQAMSGLAYVQGELTGTPGYVALSLADITAGQFALSAILAALYRKAVTGKGEDIEVPMYDAMASVVLTNHLAGSVFEPPMGPPVYGRAVATSRRPFATKDGYVCGAPYTDRDWRSFLDTVGRSDIIEDPRFSSVYERSTRMNELYALIEPLFMELTTDEWVARLEEIGIPGGRVQSTEDVLADEGLAAGGFFPEVDHPTEGPMRFVGNPIRFAEAPCSVHHVPPRLGGDTADVLREAGFADDEVESLTRDEVVVQALPVEAAV